MASSIGPDAPPDGDSWWLDGGRRPRLGGDRGARIGGGRGPRLGGDRGARHGGAGGDEALAADRARRWAPRVGVEAALAIVRAFISARRLVVFGGLAIDYALRRRGGALYDDAELPDYDFLSPDGVNDAYDLADALTAAGHDAEAIRAIHTQTMRVRVGGLSVADVSSVPPAVFGAVPALEFGSPPVRFAAPAWQRVDMHLAFCFPFQGAPREDAYNRWAKDAARLAALAAAYPLDEADDATGGAAGDAAKQWVAVGGGEAGYALTGEAGYAFYLARLPPAARAGLPAVGLEWAPGAVRLAGAAGPVAVASPAPAAVLAAAGGPTAAEGPTAAGGPTAVGGAPRPRRRAEGDGAGADKGGEGAGPGDGGAGDGGAGVRWYEPFLDALPATGVAGGLAVYSTAGRLLATRGAGEHGPPGGRVASLHHVASTLLAEAAAAGTPGAFALLPAARARALYAAAAGLAARAAAALPEDEYLRWFAPAAEPLGDRNDTPSHLVASAQMARQYGLPPGGAAALGLPDDFESILVNLPANYRAGRSRPAPYDYDHPLFRRGRRPAEPRPARRAANPGRASRAAPAGLDEFLIDE